MEMVTRCIKLLCFSKIYSSEIKYVFLSYTWTANLLICMLIDCVYIMFCEDAFMITVIRYNKHLKMNKRYQYSFLNYILLMCVVTLHCAILIISREWLMRCKNLHRKKPEGFVQSDLYKCNNRIQLCNHNKDKFSTTVSKNSFLLKWYFSIIKNCTS